jgi:tetratricopeptide (TPR) repeat protein
LPPLITGDIQETSDLYDALNRVKDLNTSCGVLRIACDDFIGLIGIESAERIVGAVTKDGKASRLTDNDAVDKMLAMKHGTFEFYEVPQKELTRLDQSLALDIAVLLSKRAPLTEEAEVEPSVSSEFGEAGPEAESQTVEEEVSSVSGDDAVAEVSSAVEATEPSLVEKSAAELATAESLVAEPSEAEATLAKPELTESALEPAVAETKVAEPLTAEPAEAEAALASEPPTKPDEPKSEKRVSTLLAKFTEAKPSKEPPADASQLQEIATPSTKSESVFDPSVLDSIGSPAAKIDASVLDSIKAPAKFDPATDDLSVNAAAAVERIKKLRPPDSEIEAEAERAQKMKFASSKKTASAPAEPETDADSKRIRPAGKEPKVLVSRTKSKKVSPKVWIAIGVPVALGVIFFATRSAVANYFVTSAESQYNKKDYTGALSSISPAFFFDSSNARAHFLKGEILAAQGDQKAAYSEYDEALKLSPMDGEILRAHAFLAWHTDKYDVLKADTDNLLTNDPTAKTDGYMYGLRAKAEIVLGEYQNAIDDCTTALKLGQKTPWIYTRRGWALTYKGNPKAALKDFNLALGFPKSESTADACVGKAQALAALNDNNGALACYDEAFKINDKNADFYSRRAFLYNSMNNPEKALQDYDQALRINPAFTMAHIGKADTYIRQSKPEDALKELLSVPKKYETAALYFARASAYQNANKYDKAIACFKQGLAKNAKNPDNFLNLAYCYAGLKNYKEALAATQSAIDLKPTASSYRAWHGFYNQCCGNVVSAGKDFEQALSMNPKDPDAHFWRAGIFETKGDASAAIQDYQAALAGNPNNEAAKKKLAQLNVVKRSSSRSSGATVLDTVKIIPGDFESLMAQGYAKMKARDARGAVNYLASAVHANPNNPQARKYLGYALIMKGNPTDAISMLQSVESSGTAEPEDLRTLGGLLMQNSRQGEAVEIYLKLVMQNPADTNMRLKLAEAYAGSGEHGKAVETCQEGQKVDPGAAARYTSLMEKMQNGGGFKKIAKPAGDMPSG